MTISEFIDKILEDVGAPLDGTGFWSRTDVLKTTDYIQREISRETKNILAVTATIEPAAAATEITIDANNNFLQGVAAYRTYGGLTRPIDFYTQEQMRNYDVSWKTQTGTQIRALITDIASAEGKALLYPIPDNALNDLVVYYLKLATRVTSEITGVTYKTIEIPEADIACLEYGVKAMMYNLEKDANDQGKGNSWKGLYGGRTPEGLLTGELAAVAQRANNRREGTYRVLQERKDIASEEVITRPLYPWEA